MTSEENHIPFVEFLTPERKKRMNDVYDIETRFSIIMVISNFGSSNIKKIAKILSMNQATIHHHLQWLIDSKYGPPMLEIDLEMISKRGKYYKLTPVAKRLFSEPPTEVLESKMIPEFNRILNLSDDKIARYLISILERLGSAEETKKQELVRLHYNHFLEKIMIANTNQAQEAISKGLVPANKDYVFGSISNYDMSMKVSKNRHLIEVLKLLTEFSVAFNKLGDKIRNEMDEENISENERIPLRYHIVGGEIAEFQFRKEEK